LPAVIPPLKNPILHHSLSPGPAGERFKLQPLLSYDSLPTENKGHKWELMHHCRQISISQHADIVRFELSLSFES